METQIALVSKAEAAKDLIARANKATVTNRHDHAAVGLLVDEIRGFEKALDEEYEKIPEVIFARQVQKIKSALSRDLGDARKGAKARMISFEGALELARQEAERKAQQEAVRLAEESTLQDALEAEMSGNSEIAEAILSEPIVAATVVVPEEKLKVAGHTRRRVYKIKITDPYLVPMEYKIIDEAKIAATARAWKKEGNIIPGVMCFSEVV